MYPVIHFFESTAQSIVKFFPSDVCQILFLRIFMFDIRTVIEIQKMMKVNTSIGDFS